MKHEQKRMGVGLTALTFAGCYLGAGYVSGQEIWQFFGVFGWKAYIGLAVALLLLMLFGSMLIRLSMAASSKDLDHVILGDCHPIFSVVLGVSESLFLFFVIMVMFAGGGALLETLFSLPHYVGSIILAVAIYVLSHAGLKGMMRTFSLLVPVLVLFTVGIAGALMISNHFVTPALVDIPSTENLYFGNWILAAVIFVSYNLFSAIGILVPLGKLVKSTGDLRKGVALGGILLGVIAYAMIAAMLMAIGSGYTIWERDLPMLDLASQLWKPGSYLYGFLLFLGMFGASLSSLLAILLYVGEKKQSLKRRSSIISLLLCLSALLGSYAGFRELIAVLYPAFGYFGLLVMVLILVRYAVVIGNIGGVRTEQKNIKE